MTEAAKILNNYTGLSIHVYCLLVRARLMNHRLPNKNWMFKVFAVRITLVPETYEGVGMTQWVKYTSKGTWLQSAATQKLDTAVSAM